MKIIFISIGCVVFDRYGDKFFGPFNDGVNNALKCYANCITFYSSNKSLKYFILNGNYGQFYCDCFFFNNNTNTVIVNTLNCDSKCNSLCISNCDLCGSTKTNFGYKYMISSTTTFTSASAITKSTEIKKTNNSSNITTKYFIKIFWILNLIFYFFKK